MDAAEITLPMHEARSEQRYRDLKETVMGMSEISDKVNIHVGGGDAGGSGAAGMAALVAALGNRNEGTDSAALIAALGNRNNDGGGMAALAPLLAAQNGNNGLNSMLPLLLLALLGRGRGGLFGGGDGDGAGTGVNNIVLSEVLAKLGSIEGAIPLASCETQNAILEQTNALTNQITQGNFATLAAVAGTKDSVQNVGTVLLNATNNVGTQVQTSALNTQIAIGNDGDRTRAAIAALASKVDSDRIADLERQLAVSQLSEREERHRRDLDSVRVEVSQNVSQNNAQLQEQVQRQQQQQQQFQILANLSATVANLANDIQVVRQGQTIFNSGTMAASGTQAAANTKVN